VFGSERSTLPRRSVVLLRRLVSFIGCVIFVGCVGVLLLLLMIDYLTLTIILLSLNHCCLAYVSLSVLLVSF